MHKYTFDPHWKTVNGIDRSNDHITGCAKGHTHQVHSRNDQLSFTAVRGDSNNASATAKLRRYIKISLFIES